MSRENVNRFADFLKAKSSDHLAATIERELHQIDNRGDFVRRSVQLGNDNGFQFTEKELKDWLAELEEGTNKITFPINQTDSTPAARGGPKPLPPPPFF
jgi:hypothetical protein